MSHLQSLTYVTKYRFASYWYQIKEVMLSEPTNVLEIGVGPNLVSSFLSQQNINVVTIDKDSYFKPRIHGTVLRLPVKDSSFDTVMCCQVLEHLPFQEFKNCLKELSRITKNTLILSLPDRTPALSLLVRMPSIIFWDFMFAFPWAIRKHISDIKGHYWEIGERGYPYRRLVKEISGAGFSVNRTYRVPDYSYHRFFIASPDRDILSS